LSFDISSYINSNIDFNLENCNQSRIVPATVDDKTSFSNPLGVDKNTFNIYDSIMVKITSSTEWIL